MLRCFLPNSPFEMDFGLFFSAHNIFPLFLRLPERNVLDPNEPYIRTSQTKVRNVCLSVIFEFYLSDQIFDFRDCFFRLVGNTALCLKIMSQKWTAFVFGNTCLHCKWLQVMERPWFYCLRRFNFIKLLQIVYQGRSAEMKSKPL